MAQKKQETALTGLSDKEVLISREKYGNNLLTPPKRPSMWKLYLEKFRDPVIRILLVAVYLFDYAHHNHFFHYCLNQLSLYLYLFYY